MTYDPSEPEYMDVAGIEWHSTHAEERGTCHHCGDAYRIGDEILAADPADHADHAKALHASCWDLHEGFSLAMTKDD